MGLFDKLKKNNNGDFNGRIDCSQFNREVFMKEYKSSVAKRLPKDIENIQTQKTMLENLEKVIPTVNVFLVSNQEMSAMEHGTMDVHNGITSIAFRTNNLLGVTKMDRIVFNWKDLTDEQLTDAFILLDYYSYILKPEASTNLCVIRNMLGVSLQKRLPKDAENIVMQKNTQSNRGIYKNGIDYVIQYRANDDIYFVEIHDYSGKYLRDAFWTLGKMGYAAFALTEDEYNVKALYNDDKKMNELIEKLLLNLPKDRFIGSGYVNATNQGKQEELKLTLKNETMDDGVYKKYQYQKDIAYFNSLEKIFVTFMNATGDRIPSVDTAGYAWTFSKKEYAETIIQNNAGVPMFYKEYEKSEFKEFVKTWYKYGVSRFKLNPGINDRYLEINRDDFIPIDNIKKWNIVGSSLNQLIIRFKQNNAIQNNPTAHAMAMTMWSAICHELYRSVFLVPITYDNEPYEVEDWAIHTSLAGAERLTQIEIERQLGDRGENGTKLVAEDSNGNPIYMLKEDLIYGSEKYHFPNAGEVMPGRIMHLRTIINNEKSFLCGFTDFESLHAVFGENVRVAIQSYEEIIAHLSDAVSDNSPLLGLVINPGGNELMLSRENIEYAAKEKDNPGKIFVSNEKD